MPHCDSNLMLTTYLLCGSSYIYTQYRVNKRILRMNPTIFSKQVTYHKISSEDSSVHDAEKLNVNIYPGIQSLRRYIIAISISTLAVLAAVLALLFRNLISPIENHGKTWVSCGHSPAEAVKNGCHFDPGLFSWVPDACYSKEPGFELSDFQLYLDTARTVPVSVDDIIDGNFTIVYADGSLHDQHCIYTWRKLSIALMQRLPLIDSKTANFWHSTHCAGEISAVIAESAQGISTYSKYYSAMALLYTDCVPLF